jgi:hypothetical protein
MELRRGIATFYRALSCRVVANLIFPTDLERINNDGMRSTSQDKDGYKTITIRLGCSIHMQSQKIRQSRLSQLILLL